MTKNALGLVRSGDEFVILCPTWEQFGRLAGFPASEALYPSTPACCVGCKQVTLRKSPLP